MYIAGNLFNSSFSIVHVKSNGNTVTMDVICCQLFRYPTFEREIVIQYRFLQFTEHPPSKNLDQQWFIAHISP